MTNDREAEWPPSEPFVAATILMNRRQNRQVRPFWPRANQFSDLGGFANAYLSCAFH